MDGCVRGAWPRPDLPGRSVVHRRAHRDDRRSLAAAFSTPQRSWASPARGSRPVQLRPDLVARVRQVTDLPVGVGLGISNGAQVAEVAKYADAVIVGSALVRVSHGCRRRVRRCSSAIRRAETLRANSVQVPNDDRCSSRVPPRRVVSRSRPAACVRALHHRRSVVAIWIGEKRFVAQGGEPGFIGDLAMWAIPLGIVGAPDLSRPDGRPAVLRCRPRPARRAPHLGGRPRHLGCHHRGSAGRVDRAAAVPRRPLFRRCRSGGAGLAGRPGDRPTRQLLQPGAVRPADDAAVGHWRSTRRTARQGTSSSAPSTRRSCTS